MPARCASITFLTMGCCRRPASVAGSSQRTASPGPRHPGAAQLARRGDGHQWNEKNPDPLHLQSIERQEHDDQQCDQEAQVENNGSRRMSCSDGAVCSFRADPNGDAANTSRWRWLCFDQRWRHYSLHNGWIGAGSRLACFHCCSAFG